MAAATAAAAIAGCSPDTGGTGSSSPGTPPASPAAAASVPSVAPGDECPVTRTLTRPTRLSGDMLGDGPARPVMTSVLTYTGPEPGTLFEDSGWGGAKVLWFAAPGLSGPVVVKGRRLDGDDPVAFDGTQGEPLRKEIVIPPDPKATDWRDRPAFVRLKAPGCYAFQIDAPTGATVLVFKAVGPTVKGS